MITNTISQAAMMFGDTTNISNDFPQSAGMNFVDQLLASSDFSGKGIINKITGSNTGDIDIFEHYSNLDETNIKFLLSDVSSLIANINKVIEDYQATGADPIATDDGSSDGLEGLLSFFNKLFLGIDSVYHTNLNSDFKSLLGTSSLAQDSLSQGGAALSSNLQTLASMLDSKTSNKSELSELKSLISKLNNDLPNALKISDDATAIPELKANLAKLIDTIKRIDNNPKTIDFANAKNVDIEPQADLNQKTLPIVKEIKHIFETMKAHLQFDTQAQQNLSIGDKFTVNYLLEKLANINEKGETKSNYSSSLLDHFNSESISDSISRYISIAKERKESLHKNLETSLPHASDEEIGTEKLFNFSQSGESFNRKNEDGSKLDSFKFLAQSMLGGTSAKTAEFAKIELPEQVHYNQTFKNVKLQDITRNVASFARNISPEGTGTARLILNPASLGTVFVEIKMKGNSVELNFKANSMEATKSIESQIGMLKEKLHQNGIETNKIDVRLADAEAEQYELSDNSNKRNDEKERREFVGSFKKNNKFENIENSDESNKVRLNTSKLIEKYV